MTRELRPMLREPASVLFAMVQPLVFLALFAPLLPDSSAFGGSALQWFVPGIIAMTALMGASMTGSNLTLEINTGSHERLLVSPLRRSSLLVGRALKEVVPMLAQGAAHRGRRDAVQLRPAPRRRAGRAGPAGAVQRRHRRAVLRPGHRLRRARTGSSGPCSRR